MGVHIRYADIAFAVIPILDYFCMNIEELLKLRLNGWVPLERVKSQSSTIDSHFNY